MNGFNFSERVRHTLQSARLEAIELAHEYVGTEHLLLALLKDQGGVAAVVLKEAGVEGDAMRATVLGFVKRGSAPISPERDLPYTSRAKKVLELSMMHARDLTHGYVGTEHLLLGLIAEEKGIAAQTLRNAGLTLDETRAQVARLLGTPLPPRRDAPPEGSTATVRALGVSYLVMVEFPDGRIAARRFTRPADAVAFLQEFDGG
ncbi:MAG TPA: Clp protease N-terminal domain-containing protein [Gemmatimonadaceae bacterium]|nr:Clp protease N-terminal domain-containing protein [Gemmatimonadaceae bacterium]